MNYQVNKKGYYGNYGGAFIPEMLYQNVEELREKYLEIIYEDEKNIYGLFNHRSLLGSSRGALLGVIVGVGFYISWMDYKKENK